MKNKKDLILEINNNNELMDKLAKNYNKISFKKDKKPIFKSFSTLLTRILGFSMVSIVYISQFIILAGSINYLIENHNINDVVSVILANILVSLSIVFLNSFIFNLVFEEREKKRFLSFFDFKFYKNEILKNKKKEKIKFEDLEIISEFLKPEELKILISENSVNYEIFNFEQFDINTGKEDKEKLLNNMIDTLYLGKNK